MEAEEQEILNYLKATPRIFISSKEIARKVGGKDLFEERPHWPKPFLGRLVNRGLVEEDPSGRYRFVSDGNSPAKKRWISPQLAAILKKSGKSFEVRDE